ncbi:hypothetical protein EJB05_52211 [Eragrostis curvula]|uniref:Uncharacterized protein n=1 Tax=Eragrostis curvula TaxID=38414 RepID=A0A5J9STI6_9POAL|nr:hypothetical protein EJB05_52211 [Eragrostis curvula]
MRGQPPKRMPFLVQSGEISRSSVGRDEGSIMALLCRKPALFSCPPSHWSARISSTIYAVGNASSTGTPAYTCSNDLLPLWILLC